MAASSPWLTDLLKEAGEGVGLSLPSVAKEHLASYLSSCLAPGGSQEVGKGVKEVHRLLQGKEKVKTEVKSMEDFIKAIETILPKKSTESPVKVGDFLNFLDKTKTEEKYHPVISEPEDDEEGEVRVNRSGDTLPSILESDGETEDEEENEKQSENPKNQEEENEEQSDNPNNPEEENDEQTSNPHNPDTQYEHPVPMVQLPKMVKYELSNELKKVFPLRSTSVKQNNVHERTQLCNYCDKKFSTQYSLNNHNFKRHLNKNTNFCKNCGKDFTNMFKFKSRKSFHRHVRICPVIQFSCDRPGASATSIRDKRLHMVSVHDIPVHWCTRNSSSSCWQMFDSADALEVHRKKVHQINKHRTNVTSRCYLKSTTVCLSCEKDFKDEIERENTRIKFKQHIRKCPVEMFSCECDDGPDENTELGVKHQHMIFVHSFPLHWCKFSDQCFKTFDTSGALQSHIKHAHELDKKFKKLGRRRLYLSYLCPDCGKDFTNVPKALQKFRIHLNKCRIERFSCECPGVPIINLQNPATTNNHKKKAQHMQVFHFGQQGCMETVDCFLHFETKKELEMHISEKHEHDFRSNKTNLECNECGRKFNRLLTSSAENDYRIHMDIHSVVNFNCDCPNMSDALQLEVVKVGKQKLGKEFLTKQRHIRVEHMGWHACSGCLKSFRNQDNLTVHQERHHANPVCDLCGFVATQHSTLLKHTERDHKSSPTKCPECKLILKNDYWMAVHMRNTHRTNKTTCEECGKEYRNIQAHMMTVHTADSEKDFQCTDCGKGFARPYMLKDHQINVHIKSRPHHCRYEGCEKRYNDRGNLAAHERRRHGRIFGQVHKDSVVGIAE